MTTQGLASFYAASGLCTFRPFTTFFFLKVIDGSHIHQPPTFPVMRRQQKRRETELCIGKLIGFVRLSSVSPGFPSEWVISRQRIAASLSRREMSSARSICC
jgi:hypothetical protein